MRCNWFLGSRFVKVAVIALLPACSSLPKLSRNAPVRQAVGPTAGPLRHPAGSPYFVDQSGRVLYLAGSHAWNNLFDWEPPGAQFDYNFYLDFMTSRQQNLMRGWVSENAHSLPTPYQRTGPGTALDGGLKYDLTKLNSEYFSRIRQRVVAARDRGIYVSIMLFQGWSIEDKGDGDPWPRHWFNRSNNINGIDGDLNHNGDGHEVHTLANSAITALQKTYIEQVINTVNDLDNVLYEIANESNYDSLAWQDQMVQFIHERENGRNRHPVGMSCVGDTEHGAGPSSTLLGSHADWVAPCGPLDMEGYQTNPPASIGDKVVIPDTDHIWGAGGDRAWVLKSFCRGLNALFMDVFPPLERWTLETTEEVRTTMTIARQYSERVNLSAMRPQDGLSSTGYCLASQGSEYIVYQPDSGGFSVNLAAGTYSAEWLNPANGQVSTTTLTAGDGWRSFTSPLGGSDALLYLKKSGGTDYSCPNGYLCGGEPVTGSPDQVVCGADLQNWRCTRSRWSALGTGCSC
jgi:hypothetical protein